MKKLLLTLALAVTSVATWADRWTAPSSNDYPNETPLYVSVNINETAATYMPTLTEIAAFIDGECRAQATVTNNNGYYALRVRGGDADMNKTITIKALYNGLVYKFDHTETFDGETETHDVPLELTLSPLLGIAFDEAGPIEVTLNSTYNLAEHLTYTYGSETLGGEDATIDQDETPLTVSYSAGNYVEYFTVSEAGLLTAVAEGRGQVDVTVAGPIDASGIAVPSFNTSIGVVVSLPTVTQIVVNPTELTVYVGDNLSTLIEEEQLTISMLPAEADQGYRWSTEAENFPWNGNYIFEAAGDYEVLVYSTANGDLAPVTVTFHVLEPLSFSFLEDAYLDKVGMITPWQFNIYMNTTEGFDASLLTFDTSMTKLPIAPFTFEFSDVMENPNQAAGDAYYLTATLTGRYIGQWSFQLTYNGDPIADAREITVYPEISIQNGWQWVSPYVYVEGSEVGSFCIDQNYQDWVTNNITEMRTQEGLLYNDARLGAFGDIIDFNYANGMYKVKSKSVEAFTLTLGQAEDYENWSNAAYNDGSILETGYNWVVYPFEYALDLDEFESSISDYAQEGDQIISKDGDFVEYSDGEWVNAANFTFQPGQGYMYYFNGTESGMFQPYYDYYGETPRCYQEAAPVKGEVNFDSRKAARQMGWQIDASRFADNMCLVAAISLPKDERYLIGAFVGDECRGTGHMVKDGVAFISAAGKSGEQVSFRLVDAQTGETFAINETLGFTLKAGSLKSPISLTSEYTTGVENVNVNVNVNDNAIYDLSGRRVVKPTKGIYVVGGRKVIF